MFTRLSQHLLYGFFPETLSILSSAPPSSHTVTPARSTQRAVLPVSLAGLWNPTDKLRKGSIKQYIYCYLLILACNIKHLL